MRKRQLCYRKMKSRKICGVTAGLPALFLCLVFWGSSMLPLSVCVQEERFHSKG